VSQPLFHLSFVLHRRRIRLAPRGVVPANRVQSIVASFENHGRLGRLTLHGVEIDLHLAPEIDPMAKAGVVPLPGFSVTVAVPSEPRLTSMDGPGLASSRGWDRYVPNFECVVVLPESVAAGTSSHAARTGT
jgi:hypothetical protein